jgi:6,7-dimethyl-8-ribityllumazine synthase
MIKSLSITRRIYSKKDLRTISDFCESIGLKETSPDKTEKWNSFVAPAGAIHFNLLDDTVSPQFRDIVKRWNEYIVLDTDDPETIWFIAHERKLEIIWDSIDRKTDQHNFGLKLPGDLVVLVRRTAEQRSETTGGLNGTGKRFGIVVSRFNEFITDRLLRSAYDGLVRSGAREDDIEIIRVPGAFEIPSAARTLAETKKYDAIICLGCLLRGDTAHYDVIVNEVTRGIGQSAQETGVPHSFGVLTCDTLEQAIDRAGLKMGNKGFEAALAAVEMANLKKAISGQPSGGTSSVVGRRSSAVGEKLVARRASSVGRKNEDVASYAPGTGGKNKKSARRKSKH